MYVYNHDCNKHKTTVLSVAWFAQFYCIHHIYRFVGPRGSGAVLAHSATLSTSGQLQNGSVSIQAFKKVQYVYYLLYAVLIFSITFCTRSTEWPQIRQRTK